MKRFTYEADFEVIENNGYSVRFPAFETCYAQGCDLDDAVCNAAEALSLAISNCLNNNIPLPEPVFRGYESGVTRIAISVSVEPDNRNHSRGMTQKQAAKELGVTQSRISQLLKKGDLEVVMLGDMKLVTINSVNELIANPKKKGRPPRVL